VGLIRFLVWIVLLLIGWSFLRNLGRSLGGGAPRRSGRPAATPPERPSETLVRDRVCGTYLPRASALRWVDAGGGEHFFCSEACRNAHLAKAGPTS